MFIKLNLYTWEREGRQEPEFLSVLNSIRLRARLKGRIYLNHVNCYL